MPYQSCRAGSAATWMQPFESMRSRCTTLCEKKDPSSQSSGLNHWRAQCLEHDLIMISSSCIWSRIGSSSMLGQHHCARDHSLDLYLHSSYHISSSTPHPGIGLPDQCYAHITSWSLDSRLELSCKPPILHPRPHKHQSLHRISTR